MRASQDTGATGQSDPAIDPELREHIVKLHPWLAFISEKGHETDHAAHLHTIGHSHHTEQEAAK